MSALERKDRLLESFKLNKVVAGKNVRGVAYDYLFNFNGQMVFSTAEVLLETIGKGIFLEEFKQKCRFEFILSGTDTEGKSQQEIDCLFKSFLARGDLHKKLFFDFLNEIEK